MKIANWLNQSTDKLNKAQISTARLDCLVLLGDQLGKDKAYILAHPEIELSEASTDILNKQITQRVNHLPLAYIRGETEFYGRDFIVNEDVLVPRPESETLIDLLNNMSDIGNIIDIGTGSGALAITAKLEHPESNVIGLDISKQCLKLAVQNAKQHGVDIAPIQSDLLEAVSNSRLNGATLLANLPYVPDNYQLNKAATNEPTLAIFGGPDGLDLYRKLFQQLADRSTSAKINYLLTESLLSQHEELKKIAQTHGFRQIDEQDLIQVFTPVEQPLAQLSK